MRSPRGTCRSSSSCSAPLSGSTRLQRGGLCRIAEPPLRVLLAMPMAKRVLQASLQHCSERCAGIVPGYRERAERSKAGSFTSYLVAAFNVVAGTPACTRAAI